MYDAGMNWQAIIAEIRSRGLTLEDVRAACGFASRGHVHDLATGHQQALRWELGDALIKLHKRVKRRKVRQ